jgi:mannitol-1-phosphate 5-dehydrogenase
MIGADRALADWIRAELDRDSLAYFDEKIRTVEPSIGRMVPKTPEHLLKRHPLAVCVEPYCELPVDRDAFRGEIPTIAHMIPYSPFDFYIRRKLYLHNMSHALCAYLGAERGYTYIWESVQDGEIRRIAREALREVSAALSAEYGVSAEELERFCEDLLSRFDNRLLGDTVSRVGFDTVRKLSPTDRFMGAIRLCEAHGLAYDHVLLGFCAGFRFCPEGDARSAGVFFAAKQNPARTLREVSGIEEGTALHQKAMALLHSQNSKTQL